MAYSQVGIINLALLAIGVKRISAVYPTETTPQAIDANDCWEYVRDEVLAKKDWAFAKTRAVLAQNATSPTAMYDYAYTLPSDFLRLCLKTPQDPVILSDEYEEQYFLGDTLVYKKAEYRYSIETISDGTICLLTDYDNSTYDLYITYIKKVTDTTKYSPLFIKALSYRLAAALSLARTETRTKFADMMAMYEKALQEADGLNASLQDVVNQTGTSERWDLAGR
jgi:hypothetical protein